MRPTSDRVRESLFAILGELTGLAVLDVCAGSGALGFEALSRGAVSVVAIDRGAVPIAQIRSNAKSLGVAERIRTLRMDASAAIVKLGRAGERFDLVLLDPPYGAGFSETVLENAAEAGILAAGAQVVVESDRRHPLGDVAELQREDERRYGDTLVTFFRAGATPRTIAAED